MNDVSQKNEFLRSENDCFKHHFIGITSSERKQIKKKKIKKK